MEKLTTNVIILTVILVVTVVAGFFVYPGNFGNSNLPWRLGLDLVGGSTLVYEVDLHGIPPDEHEAAVAGLKEVIERRVNLFGVSEPRVNIAQKGDSYKLLIDLAGVDNIQDAINQIKETPVLDFREVDTSEDGEIIYTQTGLTGRFITVATLGFDNINNPLVVLEFNSEGSELFEEITARNIGRPIAIFLDGQSVTEPIVQQRISGGSAQITGSFTINEARLLVERFNAGAISAEQ